MSLEVQSVEKYGCKIITVEPSQRRIEGVIKSGAVVQIAVYTVNPFFRWPKVGENWMIRRENGTWILDSKWQENEESDMLVENLKEGDALIDAPTGNVYLSSGNLLASVKKIEELIEATKIPIVTSLPAEPKEGQEIYFQTSAMLSAAIIWRFRYNAASVALHKWEFVGGASWDAGFEGSMSKKTEIGQELTGSPKLTIPITGVYDVGLGIRVESLVAGTQTIVAAVWINGAGAGFSPVEYIHSEAGGNFFGATLGVKTNRATLTTGQIISIGVSQSPANEVQYQQGFLSLIPVRL